MLRPGWVFTDGVVCAVTIFAKQKCAPAPGFIVAIFTPGSLWSPGAKRDLPPSETWLFEGVGMESFRVVGLVFSGMVRVCMVVLSGILCLWF